jgi:hypothetical protein
MQSRGRRLRSLLVVVRVRSREGERGIVPVAVEWDPLTIEKRRKKKGGAGWA